MYNLKQIKEDLTCIDAAESLGVKIQKKGNSYLILCPSHNDKHFGSCFCYEKKWKCFACGAGGDVFSLIHEVTGYTNSELFKEAAKLTGNPDKYLEGEEKQIEYDRKRSDFPLTDEELSLLGLKKSFIVNDVKNIGFADEETHLKSMGHEEINGMDYSLYGDFKSFSLIDIYDEDKEFVKELFKSKALEKEEMINKMLSCNYSVLPNMDAELIYLLKNELKFKLVKVRTIMRKIAA